MSDHRAYPQSQESERALLGGLILDPAKIPAVSELVRAEDFYRPDHGALFALLVEMDLRRDAIDPVSVAERITREGQEQRFGGIGYVSELPEQVPATAGLEHYAQVVRQKALLRRLIGVSTQVTERAIASPIDVDLLLDEAAKDIASIALQGGRGSWQRLSMILDQEILAIQAVEKQGAGSTVGVPTGFSALDDKLAGLHKGTLTILAARPAMGKTALAMNIAQNVALRADRPVGVFTLEMSPGDLARRMMSAEALVHGEHVRRGNLDSDEWTRLLDASDALRATKLCIDDTGGLTLGDLRARSRRLKADFPDLGLIVVDYLQLMRGDRRAESRVQEISEISRGLKVLSKDLEVPVLALSQLSREVEKRADKRPLLSDLRESGAIEQDADVILFIYRDDYYNKDSEDRGMAEVIIAKQRMGAVGTIKLVFQPEFGRFHDYVERDILAS